MGFMRFNAMRRAVWVTFLYDVVTKMFGDPTNRNVWDQNLQPGAELQGGKQN